MLFRSKNGITEIVTGSVEKMLGFYLEKKLVIAPPTIKEGDKIKGEFLAVIPLSSPKFIGTVAISMDEEFCLALARAMLGDAEGTQTFSEHDRLDVVSEISNQLAGILQEQLQAKGFDVNIGLPRSAHGHHLRFIHPGRNQVSEVCLSMELPKKGFLKRLISSSVQTSTIEFCFDSVA